MVISLLTCQLEPFVAESTPQPGSLEDAAVAGETFQQQIQGYLERAVEAMCTDLTALNIGYVPPITVQSATVDLPPIPSKGSASIDIPTATPTPLGTHIISWAALTDATSIDDLLIQILVVAADTVRVTMQNPTAGAIDPDPITFQFITATAQDT